MIAWTISIVIGVVNGFASMFASIWIDANWRSIFLFTVTFLLSGACFLIYSLIERFFQLDFKHNTYVFFAVVYVTSLVSAFYLHLINEP